MTAFTHTMSEQLVARSAPPATKKITDAASTRLQAHCSHAQTTRYGNATGSYLRCVECMKRWKWHQVPERWVVHTPAAAKTTARSSTAAALYDAAEWTTLDSPRAASPMLD
eukprot:2382088-Amphidinium_carterae.1